MAGYAIIKLGGKQYVVREGEKLIVDRLDVAENKTFHPDVLFEGGDGKAELSPKGQRVTAKVLGHVQGEKIRIGKYRRRTGYRRHTGHRSKLTQIEIQSIGPKRSAAKKDETAAEKPKPKRTRSATTSSRKRTTATTKETN